jgi:deoxyribose-phosphate aldolase
MKKTVPKLKVKAAGGIKTFEDALTMIKAGADRIGASRSVEIIS